MRLFVVGGRPKDGYRVKLIFVGMLSLDRMYEPPFVVIVVAVLLLLSALFFWDFAMALLLNIVSWRGMVVTVSSFFWGGFAGFSFLFSAQIFFF